MSSEKAHFRAQWIANLDEDITLEPGDDGWVAMGDWEIRSADADFKPCGATSTEVWPWADDALAICMARPDHEHPHVACYADWPTWGYQRIVEVSRRRRVA